MKTEANIAQNRLAVGEAHDAILSRVDNKPCTEAGAEEGHTPASRNRAA